MKILVASTGEQIKVSNRDFRFLSQFSWNVDGNGYPYTRVVITKLILSANPRLVRDHKNDDKLDNQRRNIQLITTAQNIQKARPSKSKNKTSKFRGVCWHHDFGRWRATLSYRANGVRRQVHLGYFKIEEEAARAYDKAAKKRWGRFSWKNL